MINRHPLINPSEVITKCVESLKGTCYEVAAICASQVKVNWNSRLTRCAGVAKWMRCGRNIIVDTLVIELSTKLMERCDANMQIETITHEFAHIVDALFRGESDHGHTWKHIHKLIGGTGNRCHSIDREGLRNTVKRYIVLHQGKLYGLTSHRYNTVKNTLKLIAIEYYKGSTLINRVEMQYAQVAQTV